MEIPHTPIQVNAGFGWTAAGSWASAAGLFALIGILVKQAVPWKVVSVRAEEKLREDLLSRLGKVERTLDRERARHEAERALDRHKLNNVTQCFDAILIMLEAAPEKAAEIVLRIKAMRVSQQESEAIEKAAIHAAEIAAVAEEVAHDD